MDEYKTLLLSSLSPALPPEHLEGRLFHQFKRLGEITLLLWHTPELELGRMAYVNLRHPQDAHEAHQLLLRSIAVPGPRPCKRPAPATPPQPSYWTPQPPLLWAVELSWELALDYYGLYDERGHPCGYSAVCEENLMPENDQRAT
ncbi:Putative RNA-binding protein 15B [Heterocephalus glaber]|uniref:Putative RNA-binding protein 15B n=1 Tax=Heterocephalus glaber TaxID=10181 RepID=G5BD18_HETGA|nr:Putative RNA-binding protein 15B [Heterocephalus glaber]